MRPLIFKHHDHAVMFRILNELPKSLEVREVQGSYYALVKSNKVYKSNLKNLQAEDWLIKKF